MNRVELSPLCPPPLPPVLFSSVNCFIIQTVTFVGNFELITLPFTFAFLPVVNCEVVVMTSTHYDDVIVMTSLSTVITKLVKRSELKRVYIYYHRVS